MERVSSAPGCGHRLNAQAIDVVETLGNDLAEAPLRLAAR
jgi:hypothetical protein